MGAITKSFDFEVGNREKHTVSFMLSKMIGEIKINVDGKQAVYYQNAALGLGMPMVLTVGDQEKHEVRFQINTPKLFGAFRESKVQVFIDGKHFKDF